MSSDEHEQLRIAIWDYLYHHGPCSFEDIASHLQLSTSMVIGLTDHAWFAAREEVVEIATEG